MARYARPDGTGEYAASGGGAGDDVTPFHDLGEYTALRRALALRLSVDGRHLVVVVQAPAPDRARWRTALWRIDVGGVREPRRLTRSEAGEKQPAFLPDGSLLFTSGRPGEQAQPGSPGCACSSAESGDEKTRRLWLLPAGGGEARMVADPPGGIEDFVIAREAGTVVFAASAPAGPIEAARDRAERRKAAGVTAILHEGLPIRAWDHQLGPGERRLFAASPPAGPDAVLDTPRDLTPEPGLALEGQSFAVSPDGATVVTGWWRPEGRGDRRSELVAIDTTTGERRRLAGAEGADFLSPVVSPDGRLIACVRERHATYDEPGEQTLWLVPIDGSEGRELTPDLDRWPHDPMWSPDSRAVYFGAYDHGRAPVFRVEIATGEVSRMTGDDAAYDLMDVSADGRYLYALRSAVDAPPVPVRLDATEPSSRPEPIRLWDDPDLPGTVTEISATAADGERIRGWLVLPDGASASAPAPLLLWPHGGPLASWSGWHWRWSPWVMAAHGYAVLLPDPALSLGYGQRFVLRGHGQWARPAYDDLMTITDAAVAREDVDESRTGVMGGSYGGYMANWIAGRTDRFKAIVTHASIWSLEALMTSDQAHYLIREFGDPAERPERWSANDPARHVARIRTPLLVIHGDRDYRVPIGAALRMWTDLMRHGVEAKFLYFPDENHWILTPGNAAIWYETVLAFLAQHILGEEWRRPELL